VLKPFRAFLWITDRQPEVTDHAENEWYTHDFARQSVPNPASDGREGENNPTNKASVEVDRVSLARCRRQIAQMGRGLPRSTAPKQARGSAWIAVLRFRDLELACRKTPFHIDSDLGRRKNQGNPLDKVEISVKPAAIMISQPTKV
jgi:hypothetical protein